MTTFNYRYIHTEPSFAKAKSKIARHSLDKAHNAGHGDHWAMIDVDVNALPAYLQAALEAASAPQGLAGAKTCDEFLLIGTQDPCHIKQVFRLTDGKPSEIVNIFPSVDSPYGIVCQIDAITVCPTSQDAILSLKSADGTSIYAFDSLFAINDCHYEANQSYYVNLSAFAYSVQKSNQNEVIVVEDPKAIRYHRAFNDIVADNNGQVPTDIQEKIKAWQPDHDDPLLPVEINMGHSCIYLFGETFGQEDEAWCQGQVLGKSETVFLDKAMTLFDVVILREPDSAPVVVRIATLTNETTQAIAVRDYIQANIWLQASIYAATQNKR